ncbi:MAG: alpha/beta hydrolase, partial [Anaerolineae bacterium]|nr:alpha/beta hydrolase [Anaerolineae bacterium]
ISDTALNRRRGCLFTIGRGLKWFGIVLVTLIVLGVFYQTIATELDKGKYAPRGQLYTVNGHRMHLVCMGEGSSAVILQAGGVAESLWWYRVQNQLAAHTQVCAYDRAGLGWSEAATEPRDALTIVGELHNLLEQAGVPAPYVLAGHSYGAILTRIYASQYPQEVTAIVLIDSGLLAPKHFETQNAFDQWKTSNDLLQAVVWAMTRTGLMRLLLPGQFQQWGFPPDTIGELTAVRSPNQVFDTDYAERVPAMWALTEASAAAENFGDFPLAVLWASNTFAMMQQYPNLAELSAELATYSSNSLTQIIEGADHGSILGNEAYAQEVTDAILDVIASVETDQPLAQ